MTIEAHNISKRYALKTALDNVSVRFEAGKIHALLGENGAGKSTLAKIIAGALTPTSGSLCIDGAEAVFESPRDALIHHIATVQQRPLLADALTARENIQLMIAGSKGSDKSLLESLPALQAHWASTLPLDVPVRYLGGNQRFYIAFLGTLLLSPRFLILDEPSAFLSLEERTTLYQALRDSVRRDGLTVLVITHSGAEADMYADTVTVLKRGKLSDRYDNADVGKQKEQLLPVLPAESTAQSASSAPVHLCLDLQHISSRPKNKSALLDANIQVYYGGITAVTGLQEAALDTLEDVVTGLSTEAARGTAFFYERSGKTHELKLAKGALSAAFLRAHRVAIVPSDRTYRASHPALTVEEMLSVYVTKKERCTPKAYAERLIAEAGVQITPQEKASNLSGGMLQRLIITRELATNPELVILCNPLQGLDKKGQRKMTELAVQLTERGKAVLIIGAQDFPLSLCKHVYTLEGGVCTKAFESQTEVSE